MGKAARLAGSHCAGPLAGGAKAAGHAAPWHPDTPVIGSLEQDSAAGIRGVRYGRSLEIGRSHRGVHWRRAHGNTAAISTNSSWLCA
ncbi:hypothetical protein P0D87_12560 [Paraburkholderia sp. RL17-368-BIF-A]